MAMNKYTDIEIQTAENLLKCGYKWIARNRSGKLRAYHSKPSNRGRIWLSDDDAYGYYFCEFVPIFHNISIEDSEPTSLEAIVHPQILDDAERRYLSAVIKPFRKRVEYISKEEDFDGPFDGPAEFIHIELSDGDIADFPDFKANTMYKDMEVSKHYTLDELWL